MSAMAVVSRVFEGVREASVVSQKTVANVILSASEESGEEVPTPTGCFPEFTLS